MRRNIPSLSALQAFESAARHSSFTRAALELNLTPSAISRHIRALESDLGLKLFHRSRQRVALTRVGASYLVSISACLDGIEAATAGLRAPQGRTQRLNLAVLPTFGAKWLAPRLSDFAKRHPDVQVSLSIKPEHIDFADADFDAAIFFGEPATPGMVFELLIDDRLVPVCSPALAEAGGHDGDLAGFAEMPLLELTIPDSWKTLFFSAGHPELSGTPVSRYEYFTLGIQSAVAGLGILLAHAFLVSDELRDGRLVVPFPHTAKSRFNYYLAYPESKRSSRAVQRFHKWIQEAAAVTAQECRSLLEEASQGGRPE